MSTRTFSDLDAMSRHQSARELQEALRVRAMDPEAFTHWLESALTPLQALATRVVEADTGAFRPSARCFSTPEDKDRHDRERELSHAVRLALSRKAHGHTL